MKKQTTVNRKKIMIADDDSDILEVITLILEDKGFEVSTAINGEKLESMQESLPDLLLLDIWMSGRDGREICRQLKNQPATKHIPIIMLSANIDISKISAECGANDCIAKPFDIKDLLKVINKHIGQS